MKNMTTEELYARKQRQGDIYFIEHENSEFTGWYLALSNNSVIGLNTENPKAYTHKLVSNDYCKVVKVFLNEDLLKIHLGNVANFFTTFDESPIKDSITKVIDVKMAKYVHCVHFGSPKPYTWRVPEKLEKVDFRVGDIIEVETTKGKQYVEVRETAEYEYDEKTKEVLALIKAVGLPF